MRWIRRALATVMVLAGAGVPSAAAASAGTGATIVGQPAGYQAARVQWISSSLWGGSALQNAAIPMAIADLRSDKSQARSPTWRKVIATLADYEDMPAADVTPAMNARAAADAATIDAFFHALPDASGCISMGPGVLKASQDWETEPKTTARGVRVPPLRRAIADLQRGLRSDSGDTACYLAAIADLHSLESATRPQISSSRWIRGDNPNPANLDGSRIGYLNGFFLQLNANTFTDRLVSSS